MAFGLREDRFSDFRTVGPLTLAFAFSVVFDGEPVESLGRSYDTVEIDASFENAIFETAG